MVLSKIDLIQFRAFQNLTLEFSNGINLISGKNGCGKTSILESIYYLALTKSFRTTQDSHAIKYDAKNFSISGYLNSEKNQHHIARVYYSEKEGKHIFLDGHEIKKYAEYIGFIPCVLLQPDDIKLTLGSPGDRRRFMDILLSQISPVYLENLRLYKRVLVQRNALLASEKNENIENQLEIWNSQLIDFGSKIILKRLELIGFLNQKSQSFYNDFSEKNDQIQVVYVSSIVREHSNVQLADIKTLFSKKLAMLRKYELYKKTTAAGPHKDDVIFFKNGHNFKEYGSQGENKSLIIALKLLEWKYLSQTHLSRPVLLFDDIFGELDQTRMNGLLHFLGNVGQTFISTTLEDKFSKQLMSREIHMEEISGKQI